MAEYIERKKLEEAFDNADPDVYESYPDGYGDWGFGRENVRDVIRGVPTADVAPVVHGRDVYKWHKEGHCEFKCSVCGAWAGIIEGGTLDGVDFDYCPNCGAKMDGGE